MSRTVRIICVLLTLNCVTAEILPILDLSSRIRQDYNLALEAIFSMGVRLAALLDKPNLRDRNFLISPISATTLIAELMLGANGETLEELHDLISLPNDKDSSRLLFDLPYKNLHSQLSKLLKKLNADGLNDNNDKQFDFKSSNVLFHDKNVTLYEEFFKNLFDLYNAHVMPLDFVNNPIESQTYMNNWANKSTHGLIKEFLPYPPSKDTSAIFGNVLYFKADWEVPFSYQLNRNGTFFIGNNKTVDVTYMLGEMENLRYLDSKELHCQMIALPYKNNELSMYIILPTKESYNIKDFVRNLKLKDILKMVNNMENHQVSVKLPKFSLTTTLELLKPLQKYSAFKKSYKANNTNSNKEYLLDEIDRKIHMFKNFTITNRDKRPIYLENASKVNGLRVSSIVQQVKMTVDEKGTEAAAITASSIDYIGGSRNFIVDKPFTFFISHKETKAILFWGTIVDPTQTN